MFNLEFTKLKKDNQSFILMLWVPLQGDDDLMDVLEMSMMMHVEKSNINLSKKK